MLSKTPGPEAADCPPAQLDPEAAPRPVRHRLGEAFRAGACDGDLALGHPRTRLGERERGRQSERLPRGGVGGGVDLAATRREDGHEGHRVRSGRLGEGVEGGDGHERGPGRKGESLRGAHADAEAGVGPRAGGDRDEVEVLGRPVHVLEHLVDERGQAPAVRPGDVEGRLGENLCPIVEGDGAGVGGGFDAEGQHAVEAITAGRTRRVRTSARGQNNTARPLPLG